MAKEKTLKNVEKIEIKSVEQLNNLRKQIGQNENRIESANFELSKPLPEEITLVGTLYAKDFNINGKTVKSIGYDDENGNFISEAALFRGTLLSELAQVKRDGANKGKFILKSKRLSDFSTLGKSQNEQLLALQGKTLKTQRIEYVRYKDGVITNSQTFTQNATVSANSDNNVQKLLSKTETAKGYIFTVED